MIGIRADANSIIATGHMMRCLTIAREIVRQGESVTFFMADDESKKLFTSFSGENEYKTVVLGSDYRNMEGELDLLEKELKAAGVGVLLVDSYSVTIGYFERLSKICKVAYMDDLAKEAYRVDLLINYSGYSENMGYDKLYSSHIAAGKRKTKLLLGLKYAPLREQFYRGNIDNDSDIVNKSRKEADTQFKPSPEKTEVDDNSADILLATGGGDMCNMITDVLDRAVAEGLIPGDCKLNKDDNSLTSSCVNVTWHVVVGDFVENPEVIDIYAKKYDNIILHRSVKNMADLMRKCDIAVVAAGTMLTECAACGLPSIFYQVADNQKYNVEYFGAIKGMIFAGDVHSGSVSKEATVCRIFEELKRLVTDKSMMKSMGESLLEITDGRGAVRIAGALMDEIV